MQGSRDLLEEKHAKSRAQNLSTIESIGMKKDEIIRLREEINLRSTKRTEKLNTLFDQHLEDELSPKQTISVRSFSPVPVAGGFLLSFFLKSI